MNGWQTDGLLWALAGAAAVLGLIGAAQVVVVRTPSPKVSVVVKVPSPEPPATPLAAVRPAPTPRSDGGPVPGLLPEVPPESAQPEPNTTWEAEATYLPDDLPDPYEEEGQEGPLEEHHLPPVDEEPQGD